MTIIAEDNLRHRCTKANTQKIHRIPVPYSIRKKHRRGEKEVKKIKLKFFLNKINFYLSIIKDPLNDTQLLNSEDLARHTFAENYGPSSFNDAHEISNHKANSTKKHKHVHMVYIYFFSSFVEELTILLLWKYFCSKIMFLFEKNQKTKSKNSKICLATS